MSTPNQPVTSTPPSPEGGGYPFPSLVGDSQLTLAPAEVATRLAVSELHVRHLIAHGCIETQRERSTGERWVSVASLKKFIGERLSAPAPDCFWREQTYLELKWTHHEMAISRGESWNYLSGREVPKLMGFVPARLKLNSEAALTAEQIHARLGWAPERLHLMFMTKKWDGIVDIRLPAAVVPVLRVPVEAYYFWIRKLIAVGPIEARAFLSEDLSASIYAELGEFIGARRSSSDQAKN